MGIRVRNRSTFTTLLSTTLITDEKCLVIRNESTFFICARSTKFITKQLNKLEMLKRNVKMLKFMSSKRFDEKTQKIITIRNFVIFFILTAHAMALDVYNVHNIIVNRNYIRVFQTDTDLWPVLHMHARAGARAHTRPPSSRTFKLFTINCRYKLQLPK